MFDLNHAVEKWREKMFAAGIRKSTSLDELESHLRDHIARLTREGIGIEEAFDAAIQKIGQIDVLKREFAKAEGFSVWLDHCKSRGTQPVLVVIWMAASCCLLALTLAIIIYVRLGPARAYPAQTLRTGLFMLFAMCGMIGSMLLSRGSAWGCRIVRLVALLTAVWSIWQIHLAIPLWLGGRLFIERELLICGGVAFFSLLSFLLLHPPRNWDSQSKPRASWLFGVALLFVLGGAGYWMLHPKQERETAFAHDPRFVVTKLPPAGIMRYSVFPPGRATKCSIHGFLSQCTEISGVRYVITKEVAAGQVDFGATTSLTAPQFVQAFTQALETNQPEFINFRTQRRYRENLVLLTNDASTVLVLSKGMAQEFERGAN
jgi:hypothetical protein